MPEGELDGNIVMVDGQEPERPVCIIYMYGYTSNIYRGKKRKRKKTIGKKKFKRFTGAWYIYPLQESHVRFDTIKGMNKNLEIIINNTESIKYLTRINIETINVTIRI